MSELNTPNQTAILLRASALGTKTTDANQLFALAKRLEECDSNKNQFTVKTGTFSAYNVRAWRCRSKLCDHCLAYRSAKHRAILRQIFSTLKIPTGSDLKFITLTIKNPGTSITATREILYRTWRLFTKRSLFTDLFRGGSKTEEFTITPTGYHFHLHLLAVTKYIHFNELRRVWTECFIEASSSAPIINTKDGNLLIKILRVTNQKKAIYEVSKYVTKTWSFGRLNHEAIRNLGLMERWNRQFEIFGNWKMLRKEKPILDKENLSAGTSRTNTTWRDHLRKIGLTLYINHLENEVADRISFFEREVLPTLRVPIESLAGT